MCRTRLDVERPLPFRRTRRRLRRFEDQWLGTGYDAIICRARENIFDSSIVVKNLSKDLKELFISKEICLMGESGEYHTFVIDGPLFKERLNIIDANTILNSGLWSLNMKEIQTTIK